MFKQPSPDFSVGAGTVGFAYPQITKDEFFIQTIVLKGVFFLRSALKFCKNTFLYELWHSS